ncbi:hypothetical protein [Methylocystis sp.]|uniref:hypothetical protein n=1 Tax=Methylocystis sp. TaxID=1911079 RepID=UPI003D108A7C
MASSKWRGPPLRNAGSDPRECRKLAAVDNSENCTSGLNLKEIPSRATLARRWPSLKVNRLTWRWVDDATGAKGDDLQSLLAFLNEGGIAR